MARPLVGQLAAVTTTPYCEERLACAASHIQTTIHSIFLPSSTHNVVLQTADHPRRCPLCYRRIQCTTYMSSPLPVTRNAHRHQEPRVHTDALRAWSQYQKTVGGDPPRGVPPDPLQQCRVHLSRATISIKSDAEQAQRDN